MTTDANEQTRIRGYLLSQGERYSYLETWPRCVKARLEVLDSLQSVSAEQAVFKPEAEEWSITEVALHVLNGSRRVMRVVELLADGHPASSDRIDPTHQETDLTVEELHQQLLKDSVDWSAMTQRLTDTPSFDATAPHAFFGELHSRAWYLFQRVHDLDHVQQIANIKQSSGYPAA